MADTTVVHPVGNLEQRPKVQELTHGGFRNNIHHNAIEALADEQYPPDFLDALRNCLNMEVAHLVGQGFPVFI